MWQNKKGALVAVLLVLSLALVGCGGPQGADDVQQEEQIEQNEEMEQD